MRENVEEERVEPAMEAQATRYDEITEREMGRLHELLCTTQLNVRYYGCRITRVGWTHLSFQVIPALASVTALAGFLSDALSWGKAVWSLVVVLSAVVTAIAPLLGLAQKQQRVETLHGLYLHLFHMCEALMLDIERAGKLDAEHVGKSKLLRDIYARVGPLDETSVNEKKCAELQVAVRRALPASQFGLPTACVSAAAEGSKARLE